jgi:hypothetical protein
VGKSDTYCHLTLTQDASGTRGRIQRQEDEREIEREREKEREREEEERERKWIVIRAGSWKKASDRPNFN